MKKLVIFSTLTGNTEKIANAIFSVIEGEKELLNVKDSDKINIEDYDKIIVGYWVDKGDADEKIKAFMSKINNRTVATFGTLGAKADSDHAKKCMAAVREFLEANGNKVEREFICQGAISPQLIERFRKMTKEGTVTGHHAATPETEKRWAEAARHPDETDIENAKKIFYYGILFSLMIVLSIIIIFTPLNPYIVELFQKNPEITTITNKALTIYMYSVIGFGIFTVEQGVFIGLGRTKMPLLTGIMRVWLLRYVFIIFTEKYLGVYSIFWGNLFSNCMAAFIFFFFVMKVKWESAIKDI